MNEVRREALSRIGAHVARSRYVYAFAPTLVCTGIAFAMFPYFGLANIVMVYLLGATIAAVHLGRGPAAVAAISNVAAFDFCFVPPRFTLSVEDVQYLVTFAVMLIVTLVIANLTASIREQTRVADARERRTSQLYAMTRELAAARGIDTMASAAARHVAEVFDCKAVVLLPDGQGRLRYPRDAPLERSYRGADLSAAQRVLDHGRRTDDSGSAASGGAGIHIALGDERARLGVLAVLPAARGRSFSPDQYALLATFAGQLGIALERAKLAAQAELANVAAETESLRNTLLASISHDLRTPLAVIAGAGSALAERGQDLDDASRSALARSIETKAREMSDVVSNVLDLMRFESGRMTLRREWESVDDLVGSALVRVDTRVARHVIDVQTPVDLSAVYVDASLIVQVIANLLDNAAKYTPPGTRVHVRAITTDMMVRVTVDDEGPGFPADHAERLFDKFQRGQDEGTIVGAGLGLAICRAILRAHGSDIRASARPGGGARFEFDLPTRETP